MADFNCSRSWSRSSYISCNNKSISAVTYKHSRPNNIAVTLAVAAERPCDSYIRTLSRSESRGVDIEPDYDFNTICDMHTIVEGMLK